MYVYSYIGPALKLFVFFKCGAWYMGTIYLCLILSLLNTWARKISVLNINRSVQYVVNLIYIYFTITDLLNNSTEIFFKNILFLYYLK